MAQILPVTDVLPLARFAALRSLALALEDEVMLVADESVVLVEFHRLAHLLAHFLSLMALCCVSVLFPVEMVSIGKFW